MSEETRNTLAKFARARSPSGSCNLFAYHAIGLAHVETTGWTEENDHPFSAVLLGWHASDVCAWLVRLCAEIEAAACLENLRGLSDAWFRMYDASGAENYLESTIELPGRDGMFTITIQRKDRLTPAARAEAAWVVAQTAEREVERLLPIVKAAKAVRAALGESPYPGDSPGCGCRGCCMARFNAAVDALEEP